MKKINREFVLSDSNINPFGIRFLSSGYQLPEFQKNPIGYYKNKRDSGVVVRWADLAVDGDKIIGKPVVNIFNPIGEQVADEIENGFLNCASMGNIVVLEASNSTENGKTTPTVTKWYNRQCSLVDLLGNVEALGLYDKTDTPLNLKSFFSDSNKLTGDAFPLGNKNNQTVNYTVDDLLTAARKNNSINIETARQLKEQYQGRAIELNALLKTLDADRTKMLLGLSWQQLDRAGLLPELKERNLASFKEKFRNTFNTDYQS